MIYRFPDTPELEGLSLDVEVADGRVHFSPRGKGWLRHLRSLDLVAISFKLMNRKEPLRILDGRHIYSHYIPPVPSAAHARNLETALNARIFGRRRPMAATLALTDRCQCSCLHCSAAMRPQGRSELTTAEWKRVIDECLQLGVHVVTFTGGEPLLREDLEELVASVPPDRAVVEFFSNGLALTEERLHSLRAAGLFGVQLSLDSPDPDSHDAMRGIPGMFRAVERAARMAVDAGLLVAISTYASNESVDERRLTGIAALAAEWGACEVTVFDAIPTGRLLRVTSPPLDAAHRERLLLEAGVINERYSPRLHALTQSRTNKGLAGRSIGCLAAHIQIHVSAQGDFMPCDFTPLSFGNVREESIADLWSKERAHSAYRRHSAKCRMQDPEFRRRYIHTIPEGAPLPYPIAK
jgi:MoaA/NifB/PqqE/SkfB family radical SAM enzyme